MSTLRCRVFLQNKEEIYQLFSIFENREIVWRNGKNMFSPGVHERLESIYLFFEFSSEGKIGDIGYLSGISKGEEFQNRINQTDEVLLEDLIMHDSETNRTRFFKYSNSTIGGGMPWI